MSKRKSNGTFGEGNNYSVGNGRPQIPSDIKDARKLNRDEVERIVNKYLHWPLPELLRFCQDKENTATVFECLIASILAKAIHQGDPMRLDFVLGVLNLKPKENKPGEGENLHKQIVEMIHQIEHKNGVKSE